MAGGSKEDTMQARKINWVRWAGGLAVVAGLAMLTSNPAMAIASSDSPFQTTYFDVATAVNPSRAGYGGTGISGGTGDNTVRLINTTAANGTLCAMIYVFDDFEEMQTCCGCPVTPDGLRTLSTVNDLTFDFGVNKANLNAGVIEIISALQNFPSNRIQPPGTYGFCSPTALASNAGGTPIVPTTGLRAWITHDEILEPGNIVGGHVRQGASVDEFADSPLDATHLSSLQSKCNFLISNGSGSGVCTCGAGENSVATGSAAGR